MRVYTKTENHDFLIEILDDHHIRLDDQVHEIDFVSVSSQLVYSLIIDGRSYEAYVYPEEENWQVLLVGRQYQVQVMDEREQHLADTAGGGGGTGSKFQLKAPMPGMVVSVPVNEGQQIEKGQVLLVLESMKMQNELRSPRAGTVTNLRVRTGDNVEQKQALLTVT